MITQGNWIYTGDTYISRRDPVFYHANVIRGGKRVARVAGISEEEAMDNARLIAAAPKLLAVCKEAKKEIYEAINKRENRLSIVWRNLREAIAEAENK